MRTAEEIEQRKQAALALRRRRESAASTGALALLRPPPSPPSRQRPGAVPPPATVGPVDVYAALLQCPEGIHHGRLNAARKYLRDKGIVCPVGCPALQQSGAGHRKHSTGCAYDHCYKKLTRQRR